jgi:hypothetical protein
MKYIMLPDVPSGFESWILTPSWLRVSGTLHAIAWLKPDTETGDRFFVHCKQDYATKFLRSSNTQRAVVACGQQDMVGLKVDPTEDADTPLCARCCAVIQRLVTPKYGKMGLWSAQLAAANVERMKKDFRKRGDLVAEWAISQLDPADPKRLVKMTSEIAHRSPNAGTAIVTAGLGEALGRPAVKLDAPREVHAWMHAAYLDYMDAIQRRAESRAATPRATKPTAQDQRQTSLLK